MLSDALFTTGLAWIILLMVSFVVRTVWAPELFAAAFEIFPTSNFLFSLFPIDALVIGCEFLLDALLRNRGWLVVLLIYRRVSMVIACFLFYPNVVVLGLSLSFVYCTLLAGNFYFYLVFDYFIFLFSNIKTAINKEKLKFKYL